MALFMSIDLFLGLLQNCAAQLNDFGLIQSGFGNASRNLREANPLRQQPSRDCGRGPPSAANVLTLPAENDALAFQFFVGAFVVMTLTSNSSASWRKEGRAAPGTKPFTDLAFEAITICW